MFQRRCHFSPLLQAFSWRLAWVYFLYTFYYVMAMSFPSERGGLYPLYIFMELASPCIPT
jgi:hypothetical protein